ncbi:arsenite-resistant asr2 [Chlorella sorokiniana]|uniref:Arsenite-resistant asr2 n=1 Tax=Chlorella sorokiniana TaxID=3076 RepID=A0A2P6TM32_CHLSO|nr:arsenite-resistant asr2 [Chlorella sorokiniana]|eukprot:PRW45394.1 arsenite-resistant asr2 [Chlorella sorokiniana]
MCDGLSPVGLVTVIFLILFFWPLAWLPCVMPECFEQQQRPVFGWPAQAPQPPSGAAPAGFPPAPGYSGAAGCPPASGQQA